MWTYEYDDNTKLSANQLKIASEWYINRLDQFTNCDIEYVDVGDEYITISYTWDNYCRGCYMETEYEKYQIPNEIFFSDESLSSWKAEEDEKRRIKKEKERKEKQRREEGQRARRKKEKDRADYERLKAKFEGETND